MIRFACPRCGMQLSAPEDCAGRSSKCRACGQAVTVPGPRSHLVTVTCPACKNLCLPATPGDKIFCTVCGQKVQVPRPAENKTVLGQLLPAPSPVPVLAPAPPVAAVVPVAVAVPVPEPTTHCPRCQKTLSYDPTQAGKIIACPHCGEACAAPGEQPVAVVKPVPGPTILDKPEEYRRLRREREEDQRPPSSGVRLLGMLALIGGLLGLVYFYVMDTTVESGFGGRVHNIGLMQERQTGLIISGGAAGVGVLCLALTEYNRRRD